MSDWKINISTLLLTAGLLTVGVVVACSSDSGKHSDPPPQFGVADEDLTRTEASSAAEVEWAEFDVGVTRHRVTADGDVQMEDASGIVEFTLSPPELALFQHLIKHPTFIQFARLQPLPCPPGQHEWMMLKVQLKEGALYQQTNLSSCLWTGSPHVNLGQITYAVHQFIDFISQAAVLHLECTHPMDLEDGAIEPTPPIDARGLCQMVWSSLDTLEGRECRDGAIAEGVYDCYGSGAL